MPIANDDVLFVSDDPDRWDPVINELKKNFKCAALVWRQLANFTTLDYTVFVIHADLNNSSSVENIKKLKEKQAEDTSIIFLVNMDERSDRVNAKSLGATTLIDIEASKEEIIAQTVFQLARSGAKGQSPQESANVTCSAVAAMMDDMNQLLRSGQQLRREPVDLCCDALVDSLSRFGVKPLLSAIKDHDSFTYRHSMIVTLFTTALALRYNMKREDVNRLTVGALLHDVGKFVISPKILDKPTALTETELQVMRRHPIDGAQLIRSSGEFDPEIVTIARHHHELLDGTGYPDGLSGRFIPDIVRVITITDIFAALIEARPYKRSQTAEEAYATLSDMKGKVDFDILRAFEPVALESEDDILIMQLARGNVA